MTFFKIFNNQNKLILGIQLGIIKHIYKINTYMIKILTQNLK